MRFTQKSRHLAATICVLGVLTVFSPVAVHAQTVINGPVTYASATNVPDNLVMQNGTVTLTAGNGTTAYGVTINSGYTGTFTVPTGYSQFGYLSGDGTLSLTAGHLHFSGTGNFTGDITVTGGAYVRFRDGTSLGKINSLSMNSGSLALENGTGQTVNIKSLNGGGEIFAANGNGVYTVVLGEGTAAGDTATYTGSIRGNISGQNIKAAIHKVGDGTQTLSRSGGVNPNSGASLNSIESVTVDGGVLNLASTGGGGPIGAGGKGYFIDAPITVNSGGTLRFSNAWNSPATALLTINGGTVQVGAASYAGNIVLKDGARIENYGGHDEGLRAGYVLDPVWSAESGASTVASDIVLVRYGTSYGTFTLNTEAGASVVLSGVIKDLGGYTGMSVVKTGGGTVTMQQALSGSYANAVSGFSGALTIEEGTLEVRPVVVSDVTWLEKGYFGEKTITVKEDGKLLIARHHATNSSTFALEGGVMEFEGGLNTYVGTVTMQDGASMTGSTFRIGHMWDGNWTTTGNEANSVTVGKIELYGNRKWDINVGADAPLVIDSQITTLSGSPTINKSGEGRLTLTNPTSTMTGTFNATAGALQLASGGSVGAMALNMTGTDLIVGPDGAAGEVILTNDFSMSGGDIYFDVFGDHNYDVLNLSAYDANPLADDVNFFINIDAYFTGADPVNVVLFDSNATGWGNVQNNVILTGAFAGDWTASLAGGALSLSPHASSGVPEPATWVMLVLGACGVFALRRGRGKQQPGT